MSVPLPIIIALFRYDAYVTCIDSLDTVEYEKSRYHAENMRGAMDTHNCVSYRSNKGLRWQVNGKYDW